MSADDPAFSAVLPERALIRAEGEGWRGFLQGLLTQDVEGMGEGEIRYAALLTPQGRILYDLFVTADGTGAWLDVAARSRDALLGRLRMYRLRARVELEAVEGRVLALWGALSSPSGGWVQDPRLPALGWRGRDLAPPEGAQEASASDYDRHRIRLGIGDMERDGLADSAYALEANLDLLGAVDFHKGCFVGQETTSRMKRRGVARTRLAPIGFDGAPPATGAEVLAGDLRAGTVRSGVEGRAMALLRLDRADGRPLTVDGRAVRMDPPDWMEAALAAARTSPAEAAD